MAPKYLFLSCLYTGVELSKSKREMKWDIETDDPDELFSEKSLELRQVRLCAGNYCAYLHAF